MVHIHPFPIAWITGAATTPPVHATIFRMKLFTAIPVEAFRDMNSVSIVVDIPKISMVPIPKKKLAMALIFG